MAMEWHAGRVIFGHFPLLNLLLAVGCRVLQWSPDVLCRAFDIQERLSSMKRVGIELKIMSWRQLLRLWQFYGLLLRGPLGEVGRVAPQLNAALQSLGDVRGHLCYINPLHQRHRRGMKRCLSSSQIRFWISQMAWTAVRR